MKHSLTHRHVIPGLRHAPEPSDQGVLTRPNTLGAIWGAVALVQGAHLQVDTQVDVGRLARAGGSK
jgi:hypothetical protein